MQFLKQSWLSITLTIALFFVVVSTAFAWDPETFYPQGEQELFNIVNQDRTANSLNSLVWDTPLSDIARSRSKDMVDRNYFSHQISPDNHSVFDEMTAKGYCYVLAGENIGAGFENAQDLENAFMASPTHKANILGAPWTNIGIGAYKSATTSAGYWTVLFAQKCSIAPTPTPTLNLTPAPSPTITPTPTSTLTPTKTPTPTIKPSPTPTPIASSNLLLNPGFEIDSNNNGKPDNWTNDSHVSRSSIRVKSGVYSMRHLSSVGANYNVLQNIKNIQGNKQYSFGGFVNIPSANNGLSFQLQIVWLNSNGSTLKTDTFKTYSSSTNGWNNATAVLNSPSQARQVNVVMKVNNLRTSVYADDFNFH